MQEQYLDTRGSIPLDVAAENRALPTPSSVCGVYIPFYTLQLAISNYVNVEVV